MQILPMSQAHLEASVRRRLTLPKVGIGSPRDSCNFRARQQRAKHLALKCFLYRWKGLEV